MLRAILGKKLGMTQVFDSNGYVKAVTLVHIEDNVILQKKTIENDGYLSLQLGYLDKKK
jgi:large subunit ribosomal protein L3